MLNTELYVVKGKVYEQKKGFSADTGSDIGYDKGAKMIKNYYDQNQDDVVAHFMGRNIIERILNQPGVVGLRMFYAYNELGLRQLVLVGVDCNGDNVLNFATISDDGEVIKNKGIVAGGVRSCPPYCGSGNGSTWDW
jgi:hypothetical protein